MSQSVRDSHLMKVSLNRLQVDEALTRRGTDLPTFIEAGRQQGKSVTEIASDLQNVTGVPLTSRTLYRWLKKNEAAA